jgi:hypothetical protein
MPPNLGKSSLVAENSKRQLFHCGCRRAVEVIGRILNQPILGGLHHQYCRI